MTQVPKDVQTLLVSGFQKTLEGTRKERGAAYLNWVKEVALARRGLIKALDKKPKAKAKKG